MRRAVTVSYRARNGWLHPHDKGETMPNRQIEAILDAETVERLSTAFNECFSTLAVSDDVFAPDAFFDLYPPFWRFQIEGPGAFIAQLREIATGEPTARVLRVIPAANGFVMEHEEACSAEVARRLWWCEVRDGRITEVVGYCNGGWDEELRARHAAEAPMLRP